MTRKRTTMMDTPKEQYDSNGTDLTQTDPQLDALLDEVLSTGMSAADPDLAQRIVEQTLPMLGQRPVLARIGPTMLRVAAVVAIVAGAGVVAVVMTHNQAPPIETDEFFAQIGPELQALDRAIEPGNTLIDEQIDRFALRVELVSTEDAWDAAGQDTNSLIGQAVAGLEVQRFSDDTLFLWSDGSALF